MKRSEYVRRAFEAYNAGKIDADTYDAMIMNADVFCDEDEESEELKERTPRYHVTAHFDERCTTPMFGMATDDFDKVREFIWEYCHHGYNCKIYDYVDECHGGGTWPW